jgi:hypothetical protein
MNQHDVSIGNLLSELPVYQVWTALTALAVLVGGSFGLGMKVTGFFANRRTIEELRRTIEELTHTNRRRIDELTYKHKFFEIYLRYLIGSHPSFQQDLVMHPSLPDDMPGIKAEFVKLLKRMLDDQSNNRSNLRMVDVKVIKGYHRTMGMVQFDNEPGWKIPPEIKEAVHNVGSKFSGESEAT